MVAQLGARCGVAGKELPEFLFTYSVLQNDRLYRGGGDNTEFEIKDLGREDMACQFSVASAEELGASG